LLLAPLLKPVEERRAETPEEPSVVFLPMSKAEVLGLTGDRAVGLETGSAAGWDAFLLPNPNPLVAAFAFSRVPVAGTDLVELGRNSGVLRGVNEAAVTESLDDSEKSGIGRRVRDLGTVDCPNPFDAARTLESCPRCGLVF
jgi:hypothetical protein